MFRIFVQSLICLAFVPVNYVPEVFNYLKNNNLYPIECNRLYEYFFENYIGSENQRNTNRVLYPIAFWNSRRNLFNNVPTTNNAIEGWHHIINSNFHFKCPNFDLFFKKLQQEEESIYQKFIDITNGNEAPPKQKYQSINKN